MGTNENDRNVTLERGFMNKVKRFAVICEGHSYSGWMRLDKRGARMLSYGSVGEYRCQRRKGSRIRLPRGRQRIRVLDVNITK